MTEVFANAGFATVTVGGTSAPTAGTVETWTVTSTACPVAGSGNQFRVVDVNPVGPARPEIMLVTVSTNGTGVSWTVTRGAEGSTVTTHAANFIVKPVVTAGALAGFDAAGAATAAQAAAIAASVGQQQVLLDISKQSGVDNTGVTECAAAINTALASAASLGLRAFARGTFSVASTIIIAADCDLEGATFNYSGSGLAMQVGSSTSGTFTFWKRMSLGTVVQSGKPGTGWLGTDTGVQVYNSEACTIGFKRVSGFTTGLLVYGKGAGNQHSTFNVGHLDNNQVNQKFDKDATGWNNQNTFLGGRWSHNSGEGANVAGTKHVWVVHSTGNADANNNVWYNPSLESPTVVEWTIDLEGGSYNKWDMARMEFTSGSSKVRWGAFAFYNRIDGGAQSSAIAETFVSGGAGNDYDSPGHFSRKTVSGTTGLVLENGASSTNAVLQIMRAGGVELGDSPVTAYTGFWGSQQLRGKRSTDAFDRVILDMSNGLVQVGTGAAAPVSLPASVVTVLTATGLLSATTLAARFRLPVAATILGVSAAVGTAPTGASIVVDILKNGTTIYGTNPGNRPTIAISGTAAAETVPDTTAVTAGQYLTIQIVSVGSTIAGSDLTVMVRYTM